jgi:hypothetical protein
VTSAAGPAWPAVLAGLDRARADAYASGDGRRLGGVYAPGSPAGARDAQTLARLTAAGLRARGLRLRVRSATQTRLAGGRATLRVVDRLEPYTLVTADGRVVGTRPGRADTTWVVTLVRVGGDWQLWDIVRAS